MNIKRMVMVFVWPFVVALAGAALGAEPPKPSMADFLYCEVREGQLVFIVPPSTADVDMSGIARLTNVELQRIFGTTQIRKAAGQFLSIHSRKMVGEELVTEMFNLTTSTASFRHLVQSTAVVAQVKTYSTVQDVNFRIPSGPVLGVPAEGLLTLTVVEGSKEIVNVSEKTFGSLWINHPEEIRKYVMPMFKSLDIKGAFEVNPDEAVRAFAPDLPLPPQLQQRIQALLPLLNDDAPQVRTAAVADLNATGPVAVAYISSIDLTKQPLQTRTALKDFLDRMKGPEPVTGRPLMNIDFLFLCLAADHPEIPALAKAQIKKMTGQAVDFDEKAQLESRKAAVETLRLASFARPPR